MTQEEVKIELFDAETQVNEEDLNKLLQPSESSVIEEEASDEDETDETKVFKMLKQHAIDVLTRITPKRQGYYKLIWENYDLG